MSCEAPWCPRAFCRKPASRRNQLNLSLQRGKETRLNKVKAKSMLAFREMSELLFSDDDGYAWK